MKAGEGDETGTDYVRRARRNGENRWKREKGTENMTGWREGKGEEGECKYVSL
jgi:hypothetical protein